MDKRTEALVILQEECAELIQAISKLQRWGPEGTHDGRPSNRDRMVSEMGDVLAMFPFVRDEFGITDAELTDAIMAKRAKLLLYSNLIRNDNQPDNTNS